MREWSLGSDSSCVFGCGVGRCWESASAKAMVFVQRERQSVRAEVFGSWFDRLGSLDE
jgi:hypothetical protein